MFTKTDQHDEDRLRKEWADFLLSHAMTLDDDDLLCEEKPQRSLMLNPVRFPFGGVQKDTH